MHCPECETEIGENDVEFLDVGSESNLFTASKRFYLAGCGHCGAVIGSGVAGAQ
ncbi:MAG: hypothetical protein ABEI75_00305 [Halobaculum sp.]